MQIKITGHVKATCDCGHKFEISITRLEDDFTCPECGTIDRFSAEQVAGLEAELNSQARQFGVEKVREALGESMRKSAARSKHLTYKPGRKRS